LCCGLDRGLFQNYGNHFNRLVEPLSNFFSSFAKVFSSFAIMEDENAEN